MQLEKEKSQAASQIQQIKEKANVLIAQERSASEQRLGEERKLHEGMIAQLKTQTNSALTNQQARIKELESSLAGMQASLNEQSRQFQAERQIAANERTRIEAEAKERAMKVGLSI